MSTTHEPTGRAPSPYAAPDTETATDPDAVSTRPGLAEALTALRVASGMSVRDAVAESGGLHGTVSGWFSGQHLPTKASLPMFDAVLAACGVTTRHERQRWHDAVGRARRTRSRRAPQGAPPYRGLEAFRESDAEWFFGCGALTRAIVDRINDAGAGPVIVIGPSGSGKSSVLHAGAAPLLRAGADGRRVAITTPAGALDALKALHAGAEPLPAPDSDAAPDPDAAPRPVLMIDQFEELWTQQTSAEARARILRAVAAPAHGQDGQDLQDGVTIVLALRADFYGSAAAEPALLEALQSPVVVGPMDDDQLREIITAPAAKAGLAVEEPLVRLLIDEIRPHGAQGAAPPGTLPLLSHALLSTWGRAAGSTLTVADYYAAGGIGGAVEQSAEAVYAGFAPQEQLVAKRIFLRLVTIDDAADADVTLRRRATRRELPADPADPSDTSTADAVIDAFVERRLLTVGDDTVEVSHEVLLSAWERLRAWIDENRAGLVVQRQIAEATALWLESGRDPDALLSGRRLAIAAQWADTSDVPQALSPAEREFLDAGAEAERARGEHERHRYRVARRLVVALAIVSVLAITAAVLAGVAQHRAGEQRAAAETARNEAMARQIATESQKLRTRDPAVSTQMALASYRVAPTVQSRSALLDATAVHSATRIVGPAGGMATAFSPDGDWFASATADGDVRLFDPETVGSAPEPIGTLEAFDSDHPPFALAVDPSGTRIAVGGSGGSALWDVTDPAAPQRLAALEYPGDAPTEDLAFTPDGRYVLAGTSDAHLLRWDITDPGDPAALPPTQLPGGGREMVAVSPDGSLLVTGGAHHTLAIRGTARLGDPAGPGEPLFRIPADPESTDAVLSLAFSPDGRTLSAGTTGREIERWDITDPTAPRPLDPLGGFGSYVNAVAVSPDGSRIAAGSSDDTVRIWDASDGTLLEELPGPSVVTDAAFSPDGTHLLTGGVDGVSRLWPLPGPVLGGAGDVIFTDPISADGTLMLVGAGARAGALHLWDISDPAAPAPHGDLTPRDGDEFTGATDLSQQRNLAAAGGATGNVYLWNVSAPSAPRTLARVPSVVDGIVNAVAFAPDAALLAVSDQSADRVHLLDLSDPAHPQEIGTLDAGNYPQNLTFSPDGAVLSVPTADGTVELWNVTDPSAPSLRTTLTGFDTYAEASAFSPDGTLLAAGSDDRSVRIWDVSDPGRPRQTAVISELAASVYSLDFDSDGGRLSAATSNGQVEVWRIGEDGTAEHSAELTAYDGRTWDAVFGRDGLLAASGANGVTRLWSTDADAAERNICATRGTPLTDEEWARYLPGVPQTPLC